MRLGELLKAKNRDQNLNNSRKETQIDNQQVLWIAISDIEANPYQPRRDFDQKSIEELADSISKHGLLQPVLVRREDNHFQLLVGERRLRACKVLGWQTIPALIKEANDEEAAVLALLENLQRKDLDLFEQIEGFQRLSKEFSLTQMELAEAIGLSQSAVANKLRLLKLPQKAREIISRENLSERHARTLLSLSSAEGQINAAKYFAKNGLNVKQAEEWVLEQKKKKVAASKQKIIRVYKDVRLFINSVNKLVGQIKEAGFPVEMDKEEGENYLNVKIRITTKRGE